MGHRERESHLNVETHLCRYAALIRQPLLMYGNGSGSHFFESDEDIIANRMEALAMYLKGKTSDERLFNWGRTIFSESWAAILLQTAYPQIGIRLVPTDLDATCNYATTEEASPETHQKGADILFYQKKDNHTIPLLLIDVTLGSRSTVKNKRECLPLQAQSSTPVATIPLNQLAISHKWIDRVGTFGWFLDHYGRDTVYTGSSPQKTIHRHAAPAWMADLKSRMTNAMKECQVGLSSGRHQMFPLTDNVHEASRKLTTAKHILI